MIDKLAAANLKADSSLPIGAGEKKQKPVTNVKPSDAREQFFVAKAESPAQKRDRLLYKAVYYIDHQQYNKAIKLLNKVISLDPDCAFTYYCLGKAYENKGDYDNAIKAVEKAISFGSKNLEIYYLLGTFYTRKGEYNKAIAIFNKIIALNKKAPNAYNAYNELSIAYFYNGEYDNAIAAANAAIKLNSKNSLAYRVLSRSYTKQGNDADAMKAFNKAIRLDPKKIELTCKYIINAYYEKEKFEVAAIYYKIYYEKNGIKLNLKPDILNAIKPYIK